MLSLDFMSALLLIVLGGLIVWSTLKMRDEAMPTVSRFVLIIIGVGMFGVGIFLEHQAFLNTFPWLKR